MTLLKGGPQDGETYTRSPGGATVRYPYLQQDGQIVDHQYDALSGEYPGSRTRQPYVPHEPSPWTWRDEWSARLRQAWRSLKGNR